MHGEALDLQNDFTLVDYDHHEAGRIFHAEAFKLGLKADQLLQKLEDIPTGHEGATRFHDWVTLALATIFSEDLERVRKHPNGNAPERRDIVATNVRRSQFWHRLCTDYKVSMPVFEVKNYTPPTAADFQQAYSYLGHQHHGILGLSSPDLKRESWTNQRSSSSAKFIARLEMGR